MNPYIKYVRPMDDYRLELVFENGERRLFDVKPYLQRGVFVRLQNYATFQAVRVVAGSVEWPGDLDLSYDTLYLESRPIATPAGSARVDTVIHVKHHEEPDRSFFRKAPSSLALTTSIPI